MRLEKMVYVRGAANHRFPNNPQAEEGGEMPRPIKIFDERFPIFANYKKKPKPITFEQVSATVTFLVVFVWVMWWLFFSY